MKNTGSDLQIEAEFIKDTQASIPDIIKNINPVTEHFDPVPESSEPAQVTKTVQDHPGFLHHLLSEAEQLICDKATD